MTVKVPLTRRASLSPQSWESDPRQSSTTRPRQQSTFCVISLNPHLVHASGRVFRRNRVVEDEFPRAIGESKEEEKKYICVLEKFLGNVLLNF